MERTARNIGLLMFIGLALAGCDGSHGPDSLFTRPSYSAAAVPDCSRCHHVTVGPRRPVLGAFGEFGGSVSALSHHVTGTADPSPAQCLVCHEMSAHMQGTVRLRHGDTGTAIIYSAATPSSLESFCLSCHDADGSQSTFVSGGTPTAPFADGSVLGTAPYRMSAEIASQWTASFGHRRKGLTCVGDGSDGTGCHGNGHGTAYAGLLASTLTLPNPNGAWFSPADEPDYEICFSCHAGYPRVTKEAILGAQQFGNYDIPGTTPYYIPSIQTLFRDRNYVSAPTRTYEDPAMFTGLYTNLHFYHVQIGPNAWLYRDTTLSSINCIACHSVHGSNTPWGWVYDSLLFSHYTGTGTDQYGMMNAAMSSLSNYPTSCSFNCHNIFGTTHSWFEPSGE